MIQVSVLFFGPARDAAGVADATVELVDGATIADLRKAVGKQWGGIASMLDSVRFAVNESFARDDTELHDKDEVAIIPPVSGGAEGERSRIELTRETLDLQHVQSFVSGDATLGGICVFAGATREETDAAHGQLVHLSYEAYETMALAQLRRLADEAFERWSVGRLAISHRLGEVPPAGISAVIAVACGHRAPAFEACRWLIDALKKDVPIWKKDVFEDGYARWVDPRAEGASKA